MRLHSFEAPTVGAAMQQVRAALGEDAVIVAQHEATGGVRLTAAAGTAGEDLLTLLDPGAPTDVRTVLAGCLAHHRLSAKLREALLTTGLAAPGFDAATMLAQALGARFRFVPLALPAARPIAIVGLPGAGKTAVTARLAAQALVAGHAASVFTTDSGRAGGVAQLAALLRPLRLEPTPAAEPAQLAQALATTGTRSVALIDTAGINPFRAREVADLAEFVAAAMAEPVLVLPAGLDGADSVEIAANFAAIGARRMIVTRVDTARRLGSILSVADMGLAFAGASVGPAIGTGATPLTAAGLARVLLHLGSAANTQLPS